MPLFYSFTEPKMVFKFSWFSQPSVRAQMFLVYGHIKKSKTEDNLLYFFVRETDIRKTWILLDICLNDWINYPIGFCTWLFSTEEEIQNVFI